MRFSRTILIATIFFAQVGLANAEDLLVIVNEASPVSELTADEVSSIYLGETTFLGDTRVVPVGYVEGDDTRAMFLRSVLSVPEKSFKSHWMKELFRNGGTPPQEVENASAVVEEVQRNKGGIGYIYGKDVAKATGVRTVLALHF